ncbi:methyl-accepting chemotaxis protein [Phycicoccus sonneratiae]|uniref:Methyl-accepting chemotaxis protein n=1 Tax=Phycicoccus sonneratiae TaxID=2807628 RepID=A0ABS2CPD2_9MICO|nr:methyl-accepting chemotaxis protein [Phycicoccus sonneraticus]MBM6401757.1 methyl-accepting chemotaxis protein [Phycicoccus sonneraticus]
MSDRPTPALLRRYADLRLATKMGLTIGSFVVAVAVVAVMSLTGLGAEEKALDAVAYDGVTAVSALADVRVAYAGRDDLAMSSSGAAADGAVERLAAQDAAVEKAAAVYSQVEEKGADAGSTGWTDFTAGWAKYTDLRDGVLLPALRSGDVATYRAAVETQLLPLEDAMGKGLLAEQTSRNAAAGTVVEAAHARSSTATRTVWIALGVGGALALALGLGLMRSILTSVSSVSRGLRALRDGDLTVSARVLNRDDIGVMAENFNEAVAGVRGMVGEIADNASTLAHVSSTMATVTQDMAHGADSQAETSRSTAAAAHQVSANVQTVAAATEQMAASVGEIAHSANQAARVGQDAVALAAQTSQTVASLGESSTQIGTVVETIEKIAEQTNMLALNATIEAARAGDHGRGFAVVANEVKELARETRRATAEIQVRVSSIQADAEAAVAAISRIDGVVGQINDHQTTIASAVEEQTATTNEMSRNVADAATGTGSIATSIAEEAEAQARAAEGVATVRSTAGEVESISSTLRAAVGRFTV